MDIVVYRSLKAWISLAKGLFRFITDILIPVMDIYDDDPIRKDAVQHENLVVIQDFLKGSEAKKPQENRRSIRSIYSFLAVFLVNQMRRFATIATTIK